MLDAESYAPVLANVAADSDNQEPATSTVAAAIPTTHYLMHTPKDLRCPHCLEAKLTVKPARRRIPDREHLLDSPAKFGELLVADHIILGKEVEQSLHDDSVVCVVTDVGKGCG